MLVLSLFACTAEDLAALDLPAQGIADLEEFHTALVLEPSAVWLTDEEVEGVLPSTGQFSWAKQLEVTDWSGDRVQVVAVDDEHLTLRLWLDREDLVTRTYAETVGWSGQGEVELPAGWPVEPLWEEDGLTRVAVTSGDLSVEAFIESIDMDQVSLWPEPFAWDKEPHGERVYVLDGAALLEEPGGEAFAWFTDQFGGSDSFVDRDAIYPNRAELLDLQGDYALVRVVDSPLVVVGWTAAWSYSGIHVLSCNGMGLGWGLTRYGCSGRGWNLSDEPEVPSPTDRSLVPADTLLLAGDGTPVGKTKIDQSATLGPPNAWGLRSMDVCTSWGPIEVWVDVE